MKAGTATSGTSTAAVCVIAFTVPSMMSLVCYGTSNSALMLFIAGFFFVTAIVPPLVLTTDVRTRQLLIAMCAVSGVAVVWLLTVVTPDVAFTQWLRCY